MIHARIRVIISRISLYKPSSYSIMKDCWSDDKESRPTFTNLKATFDGLISQEVRYRYLRLGSLIPETGLAQLTAEASRQPTTYTVSEEEADLPCTTSESKVPDM